MLFGKKYQQLSDEELMNKSSDGDQRAFSEIYNRYSQKMMNYFYRMLWQDKEKAEDFTQEIFSKLIQQPKKFDANKKFSSWLYSVAANMCKNEYRHQEVVNRASDELAHTYDDRTEMSDGVDKQFFKSELNRALDLLNADQRTVFIMKFKQGLKAKEIAEILDCSEGTVKSRVFYSLKILSKELESFKTYLK